MTLPRFVPRPSVALATDRHRLASRLAAAWERTWAHGWVRALVFVATLVATWALSGSTAHA